MPNLYVTEQGARVEREYNRIVVSKDGEVLLDVPALQVSQIVLVGRVGVTTPALQMLLERKIDLVLLDRHGEFQGRLIGDRNHNTGLRRRQYIRSEDPDFGVRVSRAVVFGKLWNCRVRCLRIAASRENARASRSAQRLRDLVDQLPLAPTIPAVRRIEAQGARAYFSVLRSHLPEGWEFPSRQRRPPPNPFNVLLSATYTLLTEAVYSAIFLAGLDPYCGFYHTERWGRPTLALDLMEEFRPLIADSVVLTLVNNRYLSPSDFHPGPPERPVVLELEGYQKVLRLFGERLRTPVTLPEGGRRTTYQRLLEVQARRLAATIEGRRDEYQPFRSR